jgi:cell division protein FtsW
METTTLKPQRRWLEGDPVIWTVVFALSLISILVVYSASGTLAFRKLGRDTEYYLFKHAVLLFAGLASMWLCHKIDYIYFSRLSRFGLLISVPLLLFTWKYGTTIHDATRWITIPYINHTFQPSDLAKLSLIASIASMLAKRQGSIQEFQRAVMPILLWCGIICGLIGLSSFSEALILFSTCMLVMFIGRVPIQYLGTLVIVGAFAVSIALIAGQRLETVKSRLRFYMSDTEVPFQAEQSYIAIATGGIFGKGPGNSDQRNFLPHPYSDFIFAIIVEEYGLFGALVVIGLYLTLLYRGMVLVANSERAFGGLLSAGLSFSLVIHALVNMCVAVGLTPITGLTLPLVSMGGNSLLFTGITIGIIISISRGEESRFSKGKQNRGEKRNVAR